MFRRLRLQTRFCFKAWALGLIAAPGIILAAGPTNQPDHCRESLVHYINSRSASLSDEITKDEVEILHWKQDGVIKGENSGDEFLVLTTIEIHKQHGPYLEFAFPNRKPTGDPASVQFYPGIRGHRKHVLFLDLDRSLGGQWLDLNLLTPPLTHLFSLSDSEDQIQIPISDPDLVEGIVAHLNEYLDRIDWKFSRPRRALEDPSLPKLKNYQWNPNEDIQFPAIAQGELEGLALRLREEANMGEVMRELLKKHPLGRAIFESGNWDVDVEMLPSFYDYEASDPEEELEADDTYRLRPAALRVKLNLRAAW